MNDVLACYTSFMNELIEKWKQEEKMSFSGWDFSHIKDRMIDDVLPWNYMSLAKTLVSNSKSLLDIATGGGEVLSRLAPLPANTAAIEGYEPNVPIAKKTLGPLGVEVFYVNEMSRYPFDDNQFDTVLNRHGGLNLGEIYRILQNRGQLLTQQVSGNNLEDLVTFFGAKVLWPDNTAVVLSKKASKLGFKIKRVEDWSGYTEFLDVGALVYFLRAIPWAVPGFTVESHIVYLQRLQERLDNGDKLCFSIGRFFLNLEK